MQFPFDSTTPLYAGFFGFMLVVLSWRVVRLREKLQVKMGDGGHEVLTAATRAQGNLIEYLPTALILMLSAEFGGLHPLFIHLLGILLIVARLMHVKGINDPSGKSKLRRIGTRLTWLQIGLSSVACILAAFGVFAE